MSDAGKTPESPRWKWDGGDRFSIGGRMYVGAEVAELLDRYEQQDRMKTREINLIVPENKALEAALRAAEWTEHGEELGQRPHCGLCFRFQSEGHKPDCLVGAALISPSEAK